MTLLHKTLHAATGATERYVAFGSTCSAVEDLESPTTSFFPDDDEERPQQRRRQAELGIIRIDGGNGYGHDDDGG